MGEQAITTVVESQDNFPTWEKPAWPPNVSGGLQSPVATVLKPLRGDEARELCDRIRESIHFVRGALLALYEGEGWRALGYSSWRDCVVNEFEQSKSFCYRALLAARVERNFSQLGNFDATTIPESHLLPLTDLEPNAQLEAYRLALEWGQERGRTTTKDVKRAVAELNKGYRLDNPDAHDEHYTPDWIWQAAQEVMGSIDLDPASNSHEKPHVTGAMRHYTKADNGLYQPWSGNVWLNPPYCKGEVSTIKSWIEAVTKYVQNGQVKQAILLVPSYTDTSWWNLLMDLGPVVCFFRGRLRYFGNSDAARFPSALIYIGENLGGFWYQFRPHGRIYQEIEPGMFGE